jgi:hypothetical protein
MQPKTIKIIYWITTIVYGLFAISSIFFINSAESAAGMLHLAVPHWFALELTYGKTIGGIILIVPMLPARLKEWTYAAFGIDCISAIIAYAAVDGVVAHTFAPLIFFVLLLVSYITFHKTYGKGMYGR